MSTIEFPRLASGSYWQLVEVNHFVVLEDLFEAFAPAFGLQCLKALPSGFARVLCLWVRWHLQDTVKRVST